MRKSHASIVSALKLDAVCALKLEPTGCDQGSPLAPSGAVAQACPGRTLTTAIMAEEHCARLWGAKTLGYTGPQR